MLGLLLASFLALAQDPAPAVPAPAVPVPVAPAPPVAAPSPAVPNVAVGHLAPAFTLPVVNQKVATELLGSSSVALGDFTGLRPKIASKVLVLAFVRRVDGEPTLRELERVHRKYNKRGVEVVAIVGDGGVIADVSGWVQGLDLSYPVAFDAYDIVVGRYGVREWPLTVMVDGHDAIIPGRKGRSTRKVDDSGDVLALGTGVRALASEVDVLLEGLVAE